MLELGFIKQFSSFYHILPEKFRWKFYGVLMSVLFISIFDLFSIASVLPLITVLTNENVVHSNEILSTIFVFFGFTTVGEFILFITFCILGLFVVKNVIYVLLIKNQAQFSYYLSREISLRQYLNYYSKGFSFISSKNSTVLVRDIFNMPSNFANGITNSIVIFLSEFTILAFILIGLVVYQPLLMMGIFLLLVPSFLLSYRLVKRKNKNIELQMLEVGPKINQYLFNSFLGFIDVKLFGKERYFFNKYGDLIRKYSDLNVSKTTYNSITPKIFEVNIFLAIFFIVFYGVVVLRNPGEVVAILGVFALSAYKLIPSLNKIFAAVVAIKSYDYIFEYFENIKEIDITGMLDKKSKVSGLKYDELISLKEISFSYSTGGAAVLDNFSLEIKRGEYVGIIGKSGAGKTTLIKLFLRFLRESKGSISVDGVIVDESNSDQWREIIGYVPQQGYILDGSLIENIAFGEDPEDVDIDTINQTIDLCCLREFVENLPNGLMEPIGEGGNKVSGGQKQRIVMARALYRNAKILILDEATSSLDNETEIELMQTISNLKKSNISIVSIAHRYTTLKYCDHIIELEKGQIVNRLSYEELKKRI